MEGTTLKLYASLQKPPDLRSQQMVHARRGHHPGLLGETLLDRCISSGLLEEQHDRDHGQESVHSQVQSRRREDGGHLPPRLVDPPHFHEPVNILEDATRSEINSLCLGCRRTAVAVPTAAAFYHFSHDLQKKGIASVPSLLDAWDLHSQWDAISVQELIKPEDDASDSDANELGGGMTDAIVVRGLGKGGHILAHSPHRCGQHSVGIFVHATWGRENSSARRVGRSVAVTLAAFVVLSRIDRQRQILSVHLPTSFRDMPDDLENYSLHVDGLAQLMRGQRRSLVLGGMDASATRRSLPQGVGNGDLSEPLPERRLRGDLAAAHGLQAHGVGQHLRSLVAHVGRPRGQERQGRMGR